MCLPKPWLTSNIVYDLLLLENQVPFFVLERLFNLSLFWTIHISLLKVTLYPLSHNWLMPNRLCFNPLTSKKFMGCPFQGIPCTCEFHDPLFHRNNKWWLLHNIQSFFLWNHVHICLWGFFALLGRDSFTCFSREWCMDESL